jgi:hypothetical protein
MKEGGLLSIWFFVGLSLGVPGVLILGEGIYELAHPPEFPVALSSLHANVWWGAVLTIAGVLYCYIYRPKRS